MSGRVYERKFDWDEARRLCRDGMSSRVIGERLGVSGSAIRQVCRDIPKPSLVKVRDGEAWCPNCQSWKPLADFSPSSHRPQRGVHVECRACDTARRRAWRDEHRERQRAYDRERKRRLRRPEAVA